MKISNNFFGIRISAAGLSIQRKKMNLISENIANVNTTRTEDGGPYKKKILAVKNENNSFKKSLEIESNTLKLNTSNNAHIAYAPQVNTNQPESKLGLTEEIKNDSTIGDIVYMPEHPDADSKGYVQMPNVNIVTEMVDMISASRSYEANLTALNTSKQMAKDSLEI